jgi:hypothetical protein
MDMTPRETSLTLLMQRSMMTRNNTAKSALGWGFGEAAAAVASAAATAQLDVMKLSVAQLKAELKKRGRVMGGNKSVLQVRLKEAINLNVPVSEEAGGNEAPCPEFMAGLDVTVRWELLSRCNDPGPELTTTMEVYGRPPR